MSCDPTPTPRGIRSGRLSNAARAGLLIVGLFIAVACLRFDLFAPASASPSPAWRDEGPSFSTAPLQNVPVVVSVVTDEHGAFTATVVNRGSTTLTYYGGREDITQFQEVEEFGAWVPGGWDWCGTGKSTFELASGEQVQFHGSFWEPRRERMLGEFTEKGTERRGLVVLAAEGFRIAPNAWMIVIAFSVSAVAFYLWLGVRVINGGREKRLLRLAAVMTFLFATVGYGLSYGPAAYWLPHGGFMHHVLCWLYLPCTWLKDHSPEPIRAAILWYDWSWSYPAI